MATWIYAICVLAVHCMCTSGLLDGGLQPALEQKIDQLTQRVLQLEQNADIRTCCTEPIAFTATLTNTIANMGSHQHIVFDHAITNVGNAYSALHGIFTAPMSGVYAFFVTITTRPQHSVSIELMKNGQGIGHGLAHGSTTDLHVTTTIAVTIHLAKGDQVWVQNEHSYSTVEELDGYGWSSYSGHLIAAD